jgi:hypothetical protein
VRLVREAHRRVVEAPLALDPDIEGPIDHDLRDAVVGKEPLEWPVPENVVGDLRRQSLAVVPRDALLPREVGADVPRDPLSERVWIHVHVEELRTQLSDHREVDPVLELAEGISAGRSGNGSGG